MLTSQTKCGLLITTHKFEGRNMQDHIFEVYFDGGCPACQREIAFIKRRDRKGKIRFRDLQQIDFESENLGKTYSELMEKMHARLPDGAWVVGVDAFRRMYDAIGWKWAVRVTRLPVVSPILENLYSAFAKRRVAWFGRCNSSCQSGQGS